LDLYLCLGFDFAVFHSSSAAELVFVGRATMLKQHPPAKQARLGWEIKLED
jgi:hypothetical protein